MAQNKYTSTAFAASTPSLARSLSQCPSVTAVRPVCTQPTAVFRPLSAPGYRRSVAPPRIYITSSSPVGAPVAQLHRRDFVPQLLTGSGGGSRFNGNGSGRGRGDGNGRGGDGDDGRAKTVFTVEAAWRSYQAALESSPLQTKALTAGVLNALADVLAQTIEMVSACMSQRSSGTDREFGPSVNRSLDLARIARFGVFGMALAGPLSHFWYAVLDKSIRLAGPTGVVLKTTFDQLCFSPFMLASFFASMPLMEGKTVRDARSAVSQKLKATMFTSWKVWPLINVINFSLIPVPLRVLFVNGVSVFWVSFLSVAAA